MKRIIVYGSHYGTAKAYAEKMSEMTGVPVINYEDCKDLSPYDEIIHFGGLYAGGVKGLKNTLKFLTENANLIIVTVGLADVTNKENTDHIKKTIARQVPQAVLNRTQILHLRTPEEKKTAEVKEMIATYNQTVDFTDFNSLQQVIDVM